MLQLDDGVAVRQKMAELHIAFFHWVRSLIIMEEIQYDGRGQRNPRSRCGDPLWIHDDVAGTPERDNAVSMLPAEMPIIGLFLIIAPKKYFLNINIC